jgi:hypothetical protein
MIYHRLMVAGHASPARVLFLSLHVTDDGEIPRNKFSSMLEMIVYASSCQGFDGIVADL